MDRKKAVADGWEDDIVGPDDDVRTVAETGAARHPVMRIAHVGAERRMEEVARRLVEEHGDHRPGLVFPGPKETGYGVLHAEYPH